MSISDLVLIVTRYLAHANLHGIKRKYTFAILKKSVNYIITHRHSHAGWRGGWLWHKSLYRNPVRPGDWHSS